MGVILIANLTSESAAGNQEKSPKLKSTEKPAPQTSSNKMSPIIWSKPGLKGDKKAHPPMLSELKKSQKTVVKPDLVKISNEIIYTGPTRTADCGFKLGVTCLDKEISEIKNKGLDSVVSKLTLECDAGKGEYCYLIYRSYFDADIQGKARTLFVDICKKYQTICDREIERLHDLRLYADALSGLTIACKDKVDNPECLDLKDSFMRDRDRDIFDWAKKFSSYSLEMSKFKSLIKERKSVKPITQRFERLDGINTKIKFCRWNVVPGDISKSVICDSSIDRIKFLVLGSPAKIQEFLRSAPEDIGWEKDLTAVVSESRNVSNYVLVSAVVLELK